MLYFRVGYLSEMQCLQKNISGRHLCDFVMRCLGSDKGGCKIQKL